MARVFDILHLYNGMVGDRLIFVDLTFKKGLEFEKSFEKCIRL